MRSVAAVVAFVACVHAGIWGFLQQQVSAPGYSGQLASVSYAPFSKSAHPDRGDRPTADQIRADLKVIAPHTRAIRLYSSTGGVELVPPIAAEFGLKVTVGAWLDKDKERNEREIAAAIDLARKHRNVTAIVVGNEALYRADLTPKQLIDYIKRVKRATAVPVTTGEIYSEWVKNPRYDESNPEHGSLVSNVDFIAAHILPYWERESETRAVVQTIQQYDQLRAIHSGKRIVIAEFGWPSAGYNLKAANPGKLIQAQVLRTFVAKAEAWGIEYNIVEAIDQPWKVFEGSVGPYWGLFDADRQPKFAWTGPITDAEHWKLAGLALLLGLLFSVPILRIAGGTAAQALVLAVSANLVGAWFAYVFAFWNGHYLVPGAAFALGLGVLLLIPLVFIALARVEEIAMVVFGRAPHRLIASPSLAPDLPEGFAPKVSIHIPAYREPPEMLKLTLDSVARLEYPNFECVLIINNTPDPELWQPIEEHCRILGDRFKFLRVDNLEGFKAGALRLAQLHTAADAKIIGVLDADYVVQPNWLKDLVPLFADPKVGLVQAPQDHRDGDRSVMHHVMNGEYAGFFDIGMVQRNEVNAIIVHGTMCMIRRDALDAAGGWSSDTICEDTDLGLTILELGWLAHYTNTRYGHGLLPDNFEAFKKQRHRWAYGGFQILKKHWRRFLPGVSCITREQRREFGLGWLNWLGAESLGVVVAMLNLLWVPIVAFAGIAVPDKVLTIPIIAAFVVSVLHFATLYRARVSIPVSQMLGSVVAAMSVQWTVARAVATGLVKDSMPFLRTAKGGASKAGPDFQAFWEAVLAALLVVGAITLVASNRDEVLEINIFAGVLIVQSLPFLAAVAIAVLERSRANEFVFWKTAETRLAEVLLRREAVRAPAQVSSDKVDPVP
jgi:exo-beta-1,3-glucanase (GH17 family)/cellulose synthase/poly-beta-1,6-N-acetylglucosamine synthase-like glycosyltransferase